MTFEEYLKILDEDSLADWVNGELSFHNFARTIKHQDLLSFFSILIQFFAEDKRSGEVITLKYVMYLENIPSARQPDIMFVSDFRKNIFTKYYLNGAADLIVEIVSPESRSRDCGVKFYEYETAGVREYWLIDYERNEARFYELNKDGIYQFANIEDGIYYSRVLEGLFIKTAWLWQEELPNLMEVLKDWKLI